ncbi:mitochondrial carrier domain-containing protein [Dipodascopsis uninucleata]
MVSISKEAALPAWGYALSGATGAIIANSLVYPLDITKTKLQVQQKLGDVNSSALRDIPEEDYYRGVYDALTKIYRKGGVRALYKGLPGSLMGVASTNFAYFYWYGFLRAQYQKRNLTISTAMELAIGAAAGALAQLFTIPVSVVTTRQQTTHDLDNSGFLEIGKEILEEDGISGLWRGLKASLILVVNPAITYGMYQRLREVLFKSKSTISAYDSFLLGALSKSMATIATQPLIVAKVMVQSKRTGSIKFNSFIHALEHLITEEGVRGLFKGIGPQITKGVLVQGLLFMFRDQVELLIVLLVRFVRQLRLRKILTNK